MTDPTADLRRSFYLLLIAAAVGIAAAKVVGAENVFEPSRYKPASPSSHGADRDPAIVPERVWPKERPEPSPMFGSNDRSRWATVRAVVDDGTYVIGRRTNFADKAPPWDDRGIVFEPDYQSLDKVMNPQTGEFYSSKPPLMPTVLAGGYWLLKHALGLSIVHDRWWVVGVILLAVNVLPFGVYLWLLSRLVEASGASDFAKLLVFVTAAVGTFLSTFAPTLNNHTPAACCALFAVYPLLRRRPDGRPETGLDLAASGFFAGLTAVLDLPATALLAGLFVPLLIARPFRAMLYFLPAALVPVAGQFAANYAAMGRLLPAYSEFGGPWYNYPGSHWAKLGTPAAKGIDFAAEPKPVYAFHLLFGHHGWFSLTPVWLLAAAGFAVTAGKGVRDGLRLLQRPAAGPTFTPDLLNAVGLAASAVLVGFYVAQTNNYGGNTSGARWLFWLTPLWLLAALPAADRVGRTAAGRGFAAVLLAFSVLSVFYPAWNPWRSPWAMQLCELAGWVRY